VMETVDGLAYIGREPGEEHVYLATGDSGMGMTHGTLGGILLTDLIHGAETAWAGLYDPSRKVPMRAVATYARENANVAAQFTGYLEKGEVERIEDIAPGAGALLRRGVHKVAVYLDETGVVHEMSAA